MVILCIRGAIGAIGAVVVNARQDFDLASEGPLRTQDTKGAFKHLAVPANTFHAEQTQPTTLDTLRGPQIEVEKVPIHPQGDACIPSRSNFASWTLARHRICKSCTSSELWAFS